MKFKKDTPLLWIGWMLLLTYTSLAFADNEITIEQTGGDNFSLTISQVGANNVIKMYDSSSYVNGANVDLTFIQDNETSTNNVIELWHLDGSGNTIRWGQGIRWDSATSTTYWHDGTEGGGHYARLDIHGDNNHLQGYQINGGSTSGHTFTSLIMSDNNDVWVRQYYDGAKTLNLTTYSDGNDIDSWQTGLGANHTATITLDGTEPTTLNLIQQGTTTQSYSLSQSCVTVGGCSVTITQGQ